MVTIADPDRLARHRELLRRFVLVHLLAYVPAFTMAVAALPGAVVRAVDGGDDVSTASDLAWLLVRAALPPFFAGLVAAHLAGVPWMRARSTRGRLLAFVAPAAMTLAAAAYGLVAWSGLLAG